MNHKKRIIATLFLCLSAILLPAPAKASTNHTQSEALSWASAQIGKGLDYDKKNGNQCVDLIKYYYEYLGHANYATGNANEYAWNPLPPGWQRVYGNYQPGDIAVWKVNHSCSTCSTSALGHVGIIMSADSVGFNAVNQNHINTQTCTQNWFYVSALQCAIRPDFKRTPSDTQPPVISGVTVTDVTREGYTVNCTVTDNVGVASVQFPSWNSDVHGGSDAVWLNGAINGNTASVRVNIMDLKAGLTEGNYLTHIYAYDAAGNQSMFPVPWVFIDRTAPAITAAKVDWLTKDHFLVSCKIEDNVENNIDRVQFPAWTLKDGQDDLAENWQTNPGSKGEGLSEKNGNGWYQFWVRSSDHNKERGLYRVHIYAFDKYGNMSSYSGLPDVEMPDDDIPPVVLSREITKTDAGTIHVKVTAKDNTELAEMTVRGEYKEFISGGMPQKVNPVNGVYEFDISLGAKADENYCAFNAELSDIAGNKTSLFDKFMLCGEPEYEFVLKPGQELDFEKIPTGIEYIYFHVWPYDKEMIQVEDGKIIALKAGTTEFSFVNNVSGKLCGYTRLQITEDFGDTPKPDMTAPAGVNIWFYNQYAQAYELLERLNRLRKEAGAAPLTMDEDLLKAAMDRAAECQVSYSHTRPDGTDYAAVLPGLEHTAHAENIFCAENGDISAIEHWKNIPQDNQNMINSAFTRAGVGCVYQRESDTHTWILLLAGGTANPVSKTGEEFVKKTVSALPENLNLQMLERSRAAKAGDEYDFVLLNKLWTGSFWITCVIDPDDVSITSSNPNVIGTDPATGKIYALSVGTSNITLSLKTDSRISVSGIYTVTPAASGQTPDQNQTPNPDRSPSGRPQTPQPNDPGCSGQHPKTPAVSKPSRVTIKNAVSKSKGKAAVSWKKVSRVSGYQIRYSVKGNMKSCKWKTAAGANKTSAVLKGLKNGKKYYIQVRAYKKASGRTYYGSWSQKKRVKIKK